MAGVLKTTYDGGETWIPIVVGTQGPPGAQGEKGDTGVGIQLKGAKATAGDLPSTGNTTGDTWLVEANGHLYVWSNAQWVDSGQVQGPQGIPGEVTIAAGDARYLKQTGGTITGDLFLNGGTNIPLLTTRTSSGSGGATLGYVTNQYTFALTPHDASGVAITNSRFRYDATATRWETDIALKSGAFTATTGTFSAKVTTAATSSLDASTTVTTKGYVDSKIAAVTSKPTNANNYAEGTLIVVVA